MSDKQVRGPIWFTDDGKVVNVGFTNDFLKRMEECWHVMPANTRTVREKAPLITIESNDEMYSIPSPISGNILSFSQTASNFPDKLKEGDIVCSITREEIKKQAKAKATAPNFDFNGVQQFEVPVGLAPRRFVAQFEPMPVPPPAPEPNNWAAQAQQVVNHAPAAAQGNLIRQFLAERDQLGFQRALENLHMGVDNARGIR